MRLLFTYYRRNAKKDYLIVSSEILQAIINVETDTKIKYQPGKCTSWDKFSKELRKTKKFANKYSQEELYDVCWGIQEVFSFNTKGTLVQTLGVLGNVDENSNQVYSDNLQHIIRFTTLLMRHLVLNPTMSYAEIANFRNFRLNSGKRDGAAFEEPVVHKRPFQYDWNHPIWNRVQYDDTQFAAGTFFKSLLESCTYNIVTRIFIDSSLRRLSNKYKQSTVFQNYQKFINADSEVCFNLQKPSLREIGLYNILNESDDFQKILKTWKPVDIYRCTKEETFFQNIMEFYRYIFILVDKVYNIGCYGEDAPFQNNIANIDFSGGLRVEQIKANVYWMLGRNLYGNGVKLNDVKRPDLYLAFLATWDFVLYNVYMDEVRKNEIVGGTGRHFFLTLTIMRWLMTKGVFEIKYVELSIEK